jgi:molybdate transport system ATP-binding protein
VKPLSIQCTHKYPSGFALDVAFSTSADVTALVGPSGSGKTSILYLIAGLLAPQSGRVSLGERTLLDTSCRVNLPPERRRVGLVFQDHLLFPHLTVRQNLLYGHQRRNSAKGADKIAIEPDRVIEVLELSPLIDRPPRNLSGGEKQRVALGRALLSSPELLLMDEPLAGLDEALHERVLGYLERVLEEWRMPTLYVSHNPREVRRLATEVILLEAGRVAGSGPPAHLSPPASRHNSGPAPI